MMAEHADLAFVGGGVSSTATLELLLQAYKSRGQVATVGRPIRIILLDRNHNFGGGVPYGYSVAPGFLCNEPVGKQHPSDFAAWLHDRRDDWLGMLSSTDDPAVRRWLAMNAATLETARLDPGSYAGLFVPRAIYGNFVREKLQRALAAARATQLFEISLRHDEVMSIESVVGSRLHLRLRSGITVTTDLVVVAVGSPPPRPQPELAKKLGYTHAACSDGIGRLKADLRGWLEARRPVVTEVAILGSNACAMEVISLLDTEPQLRLKFARITVISRSGRFPDSHRSGKAVSATMLRLEALNRGASLTADIVFEAARDDVAEACGAGLSSLDYAELLHVRSKSLLASLNESERHRFVEKHGRNFKALARHTPPEYRRAAEALAACGLLRVVHGTVLAIEAKLSGFSILVRNANGKEEGYEASIVLDCRGWGYLDEAADPFLSSLLSTRAGLAQINGSRIGLRVDENFQASRGVFVMGPLLAGVCNRKHMIWNLENARRIFDMAPSLAAVLADRLFGPPLQR
jgi:uncharacterized NAD(P)/FAD-binding protein YdhS